MILDRTKDRATTLVAVLSDALARISLLALVALAGAACSEDPITPVDRTPAPVGEPGLVTDPPTVDAAAISADELEGLDHDFSEVAFFLRPLGTDGGSQGDVDESLLPHLSIRVCVEESCESLDDEGRGPERLQLRGGTYTASWRHDGSGPADYQVTVVVAGLELIDVVIEADESGRLSTADSRRLGRNVPVRLRILNYDAIRVRVLTEEGLDATAITEAVVEEFGTDAVRMLLLLRDEGFSIVEIAAALAEVLGFGAEELAEILLDAGVGVDAVALFLADTFDLDARETVTILHEVGVDLADIFVVLIDVFGIGLLDPCPHPTEPCAPELYHILAGLGFDNEEQPPRTALGDRPSGDEDVPVRFELAGTDEPEDPEGRLLRAFLSESPRSGQMYQVNEDGTRGAEIDADEEIITVTHPDRLVEYVGPQDVCGLGPDIESGFVYFVGDAAAEFSDTELSFVDLACVNDAPVAAPSVHVGVSHRNKIGIALDFSDVDLDPLRGEITRLPENGTLYRSSFQPENEITVEDNEFTSTIFVYEYEFGSEGEPFDEFEWYVSDGELTSDRVVDVVNIFDVNDPPEPYFREADSDVPPTPREWTCTQGELCTDLRLRATDDLGDDGEFVRFEILSIPDRGTIRDESGVIIDQGDLPYELPASFTHVGWRVFYDLRDDPDFAPTDGVLLTFRVYDVSVDPNDGTERIIDVFVDPDTGEEELELRILVEPDDP